MSFGSNSRFFGRLANRLSQPTEEAGLVGHKANLIGATIATVGDPLPPPDASV